VYVANKGLDGFLTNLGCSSTSMEEFPALGETLCSCLQLGTRAKPVHT